LDIVPSVQLTVAAVDVFAAFAAFAGFGAGVAAAGVTAAAAAGFVALDDFAATPPWPEHAPRPEVALVVPSLQTVAAACAPATPVLSADAAATTAAIMNERESKRIAFLH